MQDRLKVIEEGFINDILGKIEFLKDKIVVFDLDGVLCKFKYTDASDDRLLPCKDTPETLNEYAKYNDFYQYGIPVKMMQYIISVLDKEKVYILSLTQENVRKWKDMWIERHYNEVKKENVKYTYNVDEKLVYLKELKEIYPDQEIVFIEDRVETLIKLNEEGLDITCIHISSFFN